MARSLQLLLTCWMLCAAVLPRHMTNAVLWSWMLNHPAGVAVQDSPTGSQGAKAPKWLSDENAGAAATGDENDRTDGSRSDRHRHRHTNNRLVSCVDDQICGRGQFCDRHYGTCTALRSEGDHCRRDHHCQRGYDCVFGRCRKHVRKGERGARCKQDSDCGQNMCCARQHGEFVCKSRLPIGHKCFVPSGGLNYALNEVCPCDTGLVCKNVGKSRPKEEELSWGFYSENDNVRCTAMS